MQGHRLHCRSVLKTQQESRMPSTHIVVCAYWGFIAAVGVTAPVSLLPAICLAEGPSCCALKEDLTTNRTQGKDVD